MALLDSWRRTQRLVQGFDHRYRLRVLRADGQRIDLRARDTGQRLAMTRQGWQADAWEYRDMIGELRYAVRLLARSVAKVRFYAATLPDGSEDPPDLAGGAHGLPEQLAADAVENLARLPFDDGPDGFVAALVENLSIAGEGWIHGEPDGQGERWTLRSISEIVSSGDQVMLAELPGSTAAGQRPINPEREELLRCWVRHPRYGQLADSPLRAMLDVLEEVVLTGREMRAAARSRIAANGVMLVPTELSLLTTRDAVEAPDDDGDDEFLADFTRAMTEPIRNEGDAGSVVPIVLRGAAEHLKEVRHLTLQRDDASALMERLNGAVLRMLKGLDIQPEQVEGLGQVNHWTGWVIEARDVRQQVEPTAQIVASCLTKAFLRPALLALGHPEDQVRRVLVVPDVSGLVENPNRGQDARDAHDRLAISDEALRKALGFGDDDAPDDEEIQRRIAARGGLDPQTAAVVLELGQALREARGQGGPPRVIDAPRPGPALPSGDGARSARPGDRVPERATPRGPEQVTAAGVPGWRVDETLARELAGIDAALVERIVVAADAAVARVIERAGGRARNAVRRDRALAASVEGVDAALVPATLGRDVLLARASLPELLAESYDRFRGQVSRWLGDGAESVARAVLRALRLDRRSTRGRGVFERVVSRLGPHRDAAVTALVETLNAAAERALFRPDPFAPLDEPGEGEGVTTLVSPGEVVHALAVAGGGQPGRPGDGGLGVGPVTAGVLGDEGALLLGWEWQYRPERPRNTFLPHMRLDGARFTTWSDPKLATDAATAWLGGFYRPGDHKGCRCSAAPIWAVPEPGPGLERLAGPVDPALRALAEADDAAGRVGTDAQRTLEVRDRLAEAWMGGGRG